MADAYTSASQTAAIREGMSVEQPTAPKVSSSLPVDERNLVSAHAYLIGGGLQQVTTLTMAAGKRGAQQVTCDTDVMLLLCLLAAEALDARAPTGESA